MRFYLWEMSHEKNPNINIIFSDFYQIQFS